MYHVLKRMAVPDEKMLTEVKQEVDVMVRGGGRIHDGFSHYTEAAQRTSEHCVSHRCGVAPASGRDVRGVHFDGILSWYVDRSCLQCGLTLFQAAASLI